MRIPQFSVGEKDTECPHCGFKRYKHERTLTSRCCNSGQSLVVCSFDYEDWQMELATLFKGPGHDASLRRKVSRNLANAVALASTYCSKPNLIRDGKSHVFLNGRVYHKFDSLRACAGASLLASVTPCAFL